METAVSNFVEPKMKVAVLTNGYFCERIAEMARRQGAELVRLDKAWGQAFEGRRGREFIPREKPHIVAFVQAETSTGVLQPGRPSAALP